MDNIKKIKIMENGPYLVSGNIDLEEWVIEATKEGNVYQMVRKIEHELNYALCRCGKSKNPPFCDHSHIRSNFDGTETASLEPFMAQAVLYKGERLTLADVEPLCAYARFCHSADGDAWTMAEASGDKEKADKAVEMVTNCPSGRLVLIDNESQEVIEKVYEPKIIILQDPSLKCSGPLYVQGGIPIESVNGTTYETRNRVTLCRCGNSNNKPFCDATHVNIGYLDK